MNSRVQISASLLSADMARFDRSVRQVANEVDYFHCDVMDGHFVPNLTFGAPVIKAIKKISPRPLDVHLMIERPFEWVSSYIDAGLDSDDFLTFHIEADPTSWKTLKRIRDAGIRPGIVLKPGTAAKAVEGLEELVDQVLVMTVEPGFGAQKFMNSMLSKISEVRKMFPDKVVVAVDGGIDQFTAPMVFGAGARLLVAGNAIYGQKRPRSAAEKIRLAADNSF